MVDWKHVLIGTILAVITWIILSLIIGPSGYYAAFFLVALYIGYKVNSSNKNGAIHGGLMGLLGGIIIGILILGGWGGLFGLSKSPELSLVILSIILFVLFASFGGLLGVNALKRDKEK